MESHVILCDWLYSLSIMLSGFIHVIACIHSFYCQKIWHCMDIPHFIYHSSADGHVGCFHLLSIMNTGCYCCEHLFTSLVWTCVFISHECVLRGGVAGSYGNSVWHFEDGPDSLSKWLYHFSLLPAMCEGSAFSTFSARLLLAFLCVCLLLSHSACDLHFFLMASDIEHLFI